MIIFSACILLLDQRAYNTTENNTSVKNPDKESVTDKNNKTIESQNSIVAVQNQDTIKDILNQDTNHQHSETSNNNTQKRPSPDKNNNKHEHNDDSNNFSHSYEEIQQPETTDSVAIVHSVNLSPHQQQQQQQSKRRKSSSSSFLKKLNPFRKNKDSDQNSSIETYSVTSVQDHLISATSMDSINGRPQHSTSSSGGSNISERFPDKIMAELTVKIYKGGDNFILFCQVHNLSYPASNSFKHNKPNPRYYIQVQLMGDVNNKKQNKQKTSAKTHCDHQTVNYEETFEFICQSKNHGKGGKKDISKNNMIELDKTWLRIAVKDSGVNGSRMSLIGSGDKTLAHGKISMRTIYDKANNRDYTAWYRLYPSNQVQRGRTRSKIYDNNTVHFF